MKLVSAGVVARSASIVALCAVFISPPLTNAALLVCVLAFLADREARIRFVRLFSQPIGIAVALMLGSVLMGASYGAASADQRIDGLMDNRIWLFIPLFAALFADERGKRMIAVSFVLFCGVAAIVSFWSWFGEYPMRRGAYGTVFRDYVTQGMGFSLAAFIGAMLVAHPEIPSGRRLRLVLLASIALCLANVIFVSMGRSAHVTLVFLLTVYFALHVRRVGFRWPVALPVLLVVAAIASSSIIRDRFQQGLTEAATVPEQAEATSIGFRITFWKNTSALISEKPLFGHGTGGFGTAYAESVKGVEGWKGTATSDPHNQYLLTLAERGVFGLLALLATIFFLAMQKNAGNPWREIGLAVIGVWCLTNLVNSHFNAFDQSHLFVFLVGAFLAPLAAVSSGRISTTLPERDAGTK